MTRLKPWAPMPCAWIRSGQMGAAFNWGLSGISGRAGAIASLQLWATLVTQAEMLSEDDSTYELSVVATYDFLMTATGLSRKLVAEGLTALKALGLVCVHKEGVRSRYTIPGYVPGSWCKLPARAIYTGDRIPAFHVFHKRTACELHAMKMYLYYAAVRDGKSPHSMASFELISQRTGVAEKCIPRANAFLISAGLLANIDREKRTESKWREPNKYFLTGYRDLFIGKVEKSS
jgi:hypothetical protein